MMSFLTARATFINIRTIVPLTHKKGDIENMRTRGFVSDLCELYLLSEP